MTVLPSSRGYQTGKHLEAFILVIIATKPRHGGAVLSALKTLLPPVWTIDDGHVYRLLRNLESQAALESTWMTEPTGAPVRLYQITGVGRERLAAWQKDIEVRVTSLTMFLDLYAQLHDLEADPRQLEP